MGQISVKIIPLPGSVLSGNQQIDIKTSPANEDGSLVTVSSATLRAIMERLNQQNNMLVIATTKIDNMLGQIVTNARDVERLESRIHLMEVAQAKISVEVSARREQGRWVFNTGIAILAFLVGSAPTIFKLFNNSN